MFLTLLTVNRYNAHLQPPLHGAPLWGKAYFFIAENSMSVPDLVMSNVEIEILPVGRVPEPNRHRFPALEGNGAGTGSYFHTGIGAGDGITRP